MALKIFLSSTLRKHVAGYDPVKGLEVEVDGGITVAEVCKKVKIPIDNIKVAFVNGKSQKLDYILQGEERIGLFPPVGGG